MTQIIQFPKPKARPRKKVSTDLPKGVTIIFNNNAMFTAKPVEDDARLFGHMQQARKTWIEEGRPLSNLGPGPGPSAA